MQEVADEAGVNKALLHYYFRSKERLAQAVFERAVRALMPGVVKTLVSDLPLEEKVRTVVELEIDMLRRRPYLPVYILGELTRRPERIQGVFELVLGGALGRMGEGVLSRLGDQLEAEAAAGRIRAIAPEEFILNIFSMVIFPFAGRPLLRVVLGLDDEEYDALIERRKETLPAFIMSALRP